MKKILLMFSTLLICSTSFAAEPDPGPIVPTIKITSFSFSDPNSHVAEICGLVSNMSAMPTFIQVVVDESSAKPGNYNGLVGSDGNFCMTVTTFAGTAIAKILQ